MTPAEFKLLREGLGLSERDVSMLTMAKEAQIKAWEQGLAEIPAAEAGLLLDIDREVERRLASALRRALEKDTVVLKLFRSPFDFKKHGPDMRPIPSMLGHRCHTALIGRLYRALRRQGRDVTTIYG